MTTSTMHPLLTIQWHRSECGRVRSKCGRWRILPPLPHDKDENFCLLDNGHIFPAKPKSQKETEELAQGIVDVDYCCGDISLPDKDAPAS